MDHSLKGCARGTDPTCPTVFRLGSVSGIASPFLDISVKSMCCEKTSTDPTNTDPKPLKSWAMSMKSNT